MSLSSPDPSTVSTGLSGPREPVLFDRYRILGILGQGGMGTVYRGYHIHLKRPVAIKTLRLDRLQRAGAVPRFLREMELAGQLDHRHIVRTTDGGESNGIYYLVMEYLEGRDLDQILRRVGKIGVADACELARQAALGLAYAHDKLVHRDIKPSNLWLTPTGVVKVLDMGLARHHEIERLADPTGEETPDGAIIGTYDFLAPEQAAGGAVDGRTDLYSLGCTLYKLITGNTPYNGPGFTTPAEKMHGHLNVPLELTPDFRELPAEVVPILERMMAKSPADRYPTAHEAAQALSGLARTNQVASLLIDQQPDTLRPLPPALPEDLSRLTVEPELTRANTDARSKSPPKPRRWGLAAAGSALLVVGGLGLAWWLVWGRTPAPVEPPTPITNVTLVGPAAVDELVAHKFHPLLRQRPAPVGIPGASQLRWRWDQEESLVDVRGPGSFFFPLGTTKRARWTFDVAITQRPWTGECGVFWGMIRDAAVEKERTQDIRFARFQFLSVTRLPAKTVDGRDTFSVRRGNGTLTFDAAGEPMFERTLTGKHDLSTLTPTSGEKTLSIRMDKSRLRQVTYGAEDLTNLVRLDLTDLHKNEPFAGEFGVFAIHSTTFGNARFQAESQD